jgi:septin 7
VNNTDCWDPITEYVEEQFNKFLEAETQVNRVLVPDTRIHACLYFIAPSGHGLKSIDVEFMRRLHDKVNIIPVIGKSDACTKEELILFKKKVSKVS